MDNGPKNKISNSLPDAFDLYFDLCFSAGCPVRIQNRTNRAMQQIYSKQKP